MHAFLAAEVDAFSVGEKTLANRIYPRLAVMSCSPVPPSGKLMFSTVRCGAQRDRRRHVLGAGGTHAYPARPRLLRDLIT